MKINFTFENITELEELVDSVRDIADELEEESHAWNRGIKQGTPIKEDVALYEVIKRLESKLKGVKMNRWPK
tara:strand:+ start:129 stop:344 length:216 start_codon:yes stop_codon:yes gene_type:complete